MRLITLLAFGFTIAVVLGAPKISNPAQRIAGGAVANIREWPQMVNVLFTWNLATYEQYCGGVVLNNQTILTAAHCLITLPANRFRYRIGSALASSGGVVHLVESFVLHPFYNDRTEDHDVALIRSAVAIAFSDQVQPASIASIDYELEDDEMVYALGWGAARHNGPRSEELRQVQIWTINQEDCVRRYATENIVITDNMLCAGWLDVAGRGQCQGDTGGPLFHNGTVVGILSFAINCGVRFYPSVNTRISRVSTWIDVNK